MLDISTELKNLYKTDYLPYRSAPIQKNLTFTFTDHELVITNTQVVANSFSLSESLNSSEDLVFGSCESACLKVKFADVTQDLKDRTFTLTQTVNNTVIKLGTFTVDSAVKEDERRFVTITAYDNMRKFDKDVIEWYNGLTLPMALKAFRQSLCTYCGVEYEDSDLPNDTMNVERTISANTLNGLEVLRCCEAINGAFGHINRDGKLAHIVLKQSTVDETIPSSTFKGDRLKYEKYSTTPIDKLQILQEDGDIGAIVGAGTNCYQIQDNMLVYGKSASSLQTIADNVSSNIIGVTYVPFTCELLGLPYIEVGDRVTLNNTVTSYILTREMSGIQSLSDSFESQGNKEITQVTSVNTEVRQLKSKTNVLTRTVESMNSKVSEVYENTHVLLPGNWYPDNTILPCENLITNLRKELYTEINQTATSLTTEVNNVSEQLNSKIEQTATSINATVSNLAANTSAQFQITSDEISSKVEKDGIISAINQSAESVTINANKINLQGYVTYTGLSDGTTTIDGGCIKTGTILADRVRGGTLSGVDVVGNTISAEEFKSGLGSFYSFLNSGGLVVNGGGYGSVDIGYNYITVNGSGVSTEGHSHYSTSINTSLTSYGNISFNGENGASVTYVQNNFQRISSSDARLKYNIQSLDDTLELFYKDLKSKSYRFKDRQVDNNIHYGLLAQEILTLIDKYKLPNDINLVEEYECRDYMDEGMYINNGKAYRVNYEELHALHIYMIQKLYKRVEELEEKHANRN
ncbi:tail fiber domain-containing protein [Anaerosporobacter faecicola]|uniref:tail fiber domain-containing protein n=1 Tax=Anaerosporobacter faecicola TaxID=2718714 RepID=UPI00143A35E2|nr:tail fiber domain-containing protein [Anaerosporobacter faecicola]